MSYTLDNFFHLFFLVGPDGVPVLLLMLLKETGIRAWSLRAVALAVVAAVAATVLGVGLVYFGPAVFNKVGISLTAFDLIGGTACLLIGLKLTLKIDLLELLRRGHNRIEETAIKAAEVAEEPVAKGWVSRFIHILAIVCYPVVFPGFMGPGAQTFLFNEAGSAPRMSLVLLIVLTMASMLLLMLGTLSIADKLSEGVMDVLEKLGGWIFVGFGIDIVLGALGVHLQMAS